MDDGLNPQSGATMTERIKGMVGDGTPITLGLVLVVVSTTCVFAWRASATLTEMQGQLKSEADALTELKKQIWTREEQVMWQLRLANQNPTLRIPETNRKYNFE